MHMVNYVRTSQGDPVEIRTPNTQETDLPQHDRPAAGDIAQQYSSPPSSLLAFIPAMKNSARLKNVTFFFKKMAKSEISSVGACLHKIR
jgi:hypothetical protein